MTETQLASAPEQFPHEATSFVLAGPAGKLEVMVDLPAAGHARAGVGVVCHPHPLEGGTLRNKVVTMLERSLRESGLATVRFNFRGVGASEGNYDEGRGESEDLAAVVAWVRRTRPGDALWLAGFSFGSYVVLRNAAPLQADALITVAPPVGRNWDFDAIELPACPWLVVQGEADEVVDPAAVFAWLETLDPAPALVRMPDTGHFFHRRLMDLRGAVKNAVRGWLPAERAH
jgi:alpha/beta superfamily hydrolase